MPPRSARPGPPGSGSTGRVSENAAPTPGAEGSSWRSPPISRLSRWARCSPMPSPGECRPRVPRSKRLAARSGATPGPVVGDPQLDAVRAGRDLDGHVGAGRVTVGVLEEHVDDLGDLVAPAPGVAAGAAPEHPLAARPHGVDEGVDDLGERHRVGLLARAVGEQPLEALELGGVQRLEPDPGGLGQVVLGLLQEVRRRGRARRSWPGPRAGSPRRATARPAPPRRGCRPPRAVRWR